jgi:hypothetical protein
LLSLPLLPLRPVLAALPGVLPSLKNWLRLHALLAYLRGQPFLGFLSAPSALSFLNRLRPMAFRALRTIQADGLSDDCWYVVESGQVCLHSPDDNPAVPPRELGPGDCFGERALQGSPGLSVAVTLSATRCLCLPREAFGPGSDQARNPDEQTICPQLSSVHKAYVWVGQQAAADCGLASLAMVARYHGLAASVEGLRQGIAVGEQGLSLLELQRAAAGLGLRCLPVRVSPEQFAQVTLPAVAHFQGGHYVVLYEFGVRGAVIGDPAAGIVRLSHDLFMRSCCGNLLLVRAPAETVRREPVPR